MPHEDSKSKEKPVWSELLEEPTQNVASDQGLHCLQQTGNSIKDGNNNNNNNK